MEKRVVLAVVLTVAVIFLTNFLFPPPPVPIESDPVERDSLVQDSRFRDEDGVGELPAVSEPSLTVDTSEAASLPAAEPTIEGDTIVVRTDLYELRFSTLGATLVGARLLDYESYSARANGDDRVQLVRPGDRLFGYRVAAGGDTASLGDRLFTADHREITLGEQTEADSLQLGHPRPVVSLRVDPHGLKPFVAHGCDQDAPFHQLVHKSTEIQWEDLYSSQYLNFMNFNSILVYYPGDDPSPPTTATVDVTFNPGQQTEFTTRWDGFNSPAEYIAGTTTVTFSFQYPYSGLTCTVTRTVDRVRPTPTSTPTPLPAVDCSDIYFTGVRLSTNGPGEDILWDFRNDNAYTATLVETKFTWEKVWPSLYVNEFIFDGVQYWPGNDDTGYATTTNTVPMSANASSTIETDYEGTVPNNGPTAGAMTLELDFVFDDAANTMCTINRPFTINTPTPTSTPTATRTPLPCVGDCDNDSAISIDELVVGVRIALGEVDLTDCPSFDFDMDGEVTIDELLQGVRAALLGCRGESAIGLGHCPVSHRCRSVQRLGRLSICFTPPLLQIPFGHVPG